MSFKRQSKVLTHTATSRLAAKSVVSTFACIGFVLAQRTIHVGPRNPGAMTTLPPAPRGPRPRSSAPGPARKPNDPAWRRATRPFRCRRLNPDPRQYARERRAVARRIAIPGDPKRRPLARRRAGCRRSAQALPTRLSGWDWEWASEEPCPLPGDPPLLFA
jgi:hypothetical protein